MGWALILWAGCESGQGVVIVLGGLAIWGAVMYFIATDANRSPTSTGGQIVPGVPFTMRMDNEEGQKPKCREGDSVTFWHRPDTDRVYGFVAGTTGGDGRVGIIQSDELCRVVDSGQAYTAVVVDTSSAKEGHILVRVVVEAAPAES